MQSTKIKGIRSHIRSHLHLCVYYYDMSFICLIHIISFYSTCVDTHCTNQWHVHIIAGLTHLFPFISGRLCPKWVPVTDTVSPSPRARTFSHTTCSMDSTYSERNCRVRSEMLLEWNSGEFWESWQLIIAIDNRQWRVICRNINFTQHCNPLYSILCLRLLCLILF